MTIQYKDIDPNDIIIFQGAKVRIVKLYRNNEETFFQVEPEDEEALEILGNFYAYQEYGGKNTLTVTKL